MADATVSAVDAYKYERLQSPQHIRVLRLAPGAQREPIHCSLIQVHLDLCRPYEAISYAWGVAEDRENVYCDHRLVGITRNLFEALHVFRHASTPRDLWADAICINQQNPTERGSQVQLMARIYSGALKVLLWLGNDDHTIASRTFDFLRCYMTRLLDVVDPEDREMALADENSTSWTKISIQLSSGRSSGPRELLDEASIRNLIRLFLRPVFQRGWVIQEFVLATSLEVCWGMASIGVNWLCAPVPTLLDEIPSLDKDLEIIRGSSALGTLYYLRCFVKDSEPNFLDLLSLARSFFFREERDRVYGMLALRSSNGESTDEGFFVEPDYEIGKLEPYKQVAKYSLLREHEIRVLFFVRHESSMSENWPSWVPDWNKPEWTWTSQALDSYLPTPHISTFEHESLGHECLSLRGLRVDTVTMSMDDLAPSESDEHVQTQLRALWDTFDPTCVAFSATAGQSIRPWLLVAPSQVWHDDHTVIQRRACRAFLDLDLKRSSLPTKYNQRVDHSSSDTDLALRFGGQYKATLHAMRFFQTEKGRLGLGSAIVTKGDVVVLFGDTQRFAFLLRPAGTLWRLVGACYIYDIVKEEAVRESQGFVRSDPKEEFWIY
jgi:hypothetical protein